MRIAGWTKGTETHWIYTEKNALADINIWTVKKRKIVIGYHVILSRRKMISRSAGIPNKDKKTITITEAKKLAYKWMKAVSRKRKTQRTRLQKITRLRKRRKTRQNKKKKG
jgi:hypothetical protein